MTEHALKRLRQRLLPNASMANVIEAVDRCMARRDVELIATSGGGSESYRMTLCGVELVAVLIRGAGVIVTFFEPGHNPNCPLRRRGSSGARLDAAGHRGRAVRRRMRERAMQEEDLDDAG